MKRILSILVLGAVLAFAGGALADEAMKGHSHAMGAAAKSMTVKGEVVDMGCYMAHSASGEKHKECGTKCVAGGMPMGLLTSNGKLYLITLNHDDADPYNHLKEWVGDQVEVTGAIYQRGGMMAIDASAAKPATAAAK